MSETTPKTDLIRRVVIVGRDEALWLSANALWSAFGRTGLEIVAVELPSAHQVGHAITTLRHHAGFHALLRLKEEPLINVCQGTYSLGTRFSGFNGDESSYMHTHGSVGKPLNRVKFHDFWTKARSRGLKASFDDFSLSAAAARYGHFFIPNDDTDTLGAFGYGYHLEATAYCGLLKQVALQRGIKAHVTPEIDVLRHSASGEIKAVQLKDGTALEGDFFIDATGEDSLLLGRAMDVAFDSWRHWFPCDRILSVSAPALSRLPAFAQVTATSTGWVGIYPLRERTALIKAYPSQHMDEPVALNALLNTVRLPLNSDATSRQINVGRRVHAWQGNCLAIGGSVVMFDPLNGANSQAILAGLVHLISLFPVHQKMDAERREYNRVMGTVYDRIRDFQLCHYSLNTRHGEALWDHCRGNKLPEALAFKMDLFAARGILTEYDDETFNEDDWLMLLLGQGCVPKAYDPLADEVPDAEAIKYLQSILGSIRKQVELMRPMETFLKKAQTFSV